MGSVVVTPLWTTAANKCVVILDFRGLGGKAFAEIVYDVLSHSFCMQQGRSLGFEDFSAYAFGSNSPLLPGASLSAVPGGTIQFCRAGSEPVRFGTLDSRINCRAFWPRVSVSSEEFDVPSLLALYADQHAVVQLCGTEQGVPRGYLESLVERGHGEATIIFPVGHQLADVNVRGVSCQNAAAVFPLTPIPERQGVIVFLDTRQVGQMPSFSYIGTIPICPQDLIDRLHLKPPVNFATVLCGVRGTEKEVFLQEGEVVSVQFWDASHHPDADSAMSTPGAAAPAHRNRRRTSHQHRVLGQVCVGAALFGQSLAVQVPRPPLSVLDCEVSLEPWACKLLQEPRPGGTVSSDTISSLRFLAGEFGEPWPFLPPLGEDGSHTQMPQPNRHLHLQESPVEIDFVLLSIDFMPEEVTVALHLPSEVDDVMPNVQANRLPAHAALFPFLIEVVPQPYSTFGVLLAVPLWARHSLVVCINTEPCGGHLFASSAPLVADWYSLLALTNLGISAPVDIYVGSSQYPLADGADTFLEQGMLITFAPALDDAPAFYDLGAMLETGLSWGSLSDREVSVTPAAFCLCVTGGHHVLEAPHDRDVHRSDIARLLELQEDSLVVTPANPRIRDVAVRGRPCLTVVAADETTEVGVSLGLVDCRALHQGWLCLNFRQGRVLLTQLEEDLGAFAPVGWQAVILGANPVDDTLFMQPGQTLVAAYTPLDRAALEPEGSEPSDGDDSSPSSDADSDFADTEAHGDDEPLHGAPEANILPNEPSLGSTAGSNWGYGRPCTPPFLLGFSPLVVTACLGVAGASHQPRKTRSAAARRRRPFPPRAKFPLGDLCLLFLVLLVEGRAVQFHAELTRHDRASVLPRCVPLHLELPTSGPPVCETAPSVRPELLQCEPALPQSAESSPIRPPGPNLCILMPLHPSQDRRSWRSAFRNRKGNPFWKRWQSYKHLQSISRPDPSLPWGGHVCSFFHLLGQPRTLP